jgi:chorismate synthase
MTPVLTMIIDGSGGAFRFQIEKINHDLWRRQQELRTRRPHVDSRNDEAQVRSGIRWGETIGAPSGAGH